MPVGNVGDCLGGVIVLSLVWACLESCVLVCLVCDCLVGVIVLSLA